MLYVGLYPDVSYIVRVQKVAPKTFWNYFHSGRLFHKLQPKPHI